MSFRDAILEHKLTTLGLAFLAVLILGFALNQPGGPIEDTRGIVEGINVLPTAYGNPQPIAAVRLSEGVLVQAHIATATPPQRGQTVRILVYRRVITGGRTYHLVDPKKAK